LQRATEGIDRFLTVAAQIGIRPAQGSYDVYAPQGLDDLSTVIIRPNLRSKEATQPSSSKECVGPKRFRLLKKLVAKWVDYGEFTGLSSRFS